MQLYKLTKDLSGGADGAPDEDLRGALVVASSANEFARICQPVGAFLRQRAHSSFYSAILVHDKNCVHTTVCCAA